MKDMVRNMLNASYMELEMLTYKASTEELEEVYDIMVERKFARSRTEMVQRAIVARTPMKKIMKDMQKREVREKFEKEWTSMQKMFEGAKARKRERLAANE